MGPLPYHDAGARIAFYVVLGAFVLLEQRIRLSSWMRREGHREDRGSYAAVIASVTAGLVGAFVLATTVHGASLAGARWPAFVVGVALMVTGIALRQWSIVVLGRSFTVVVRVREGQGVVDTGPYRWVRHPSYTGLVMTLLGIGLALGNWAALACAVLLPLAGLLVRIRVEERVLGDALGEPYRRFAAQRARLIPHVW